MKNSIKLLLAPALLVLWLLPINGMAGSNANALTGVNFAINTQITTPTTLAQRLCLRYDQRCSRECGYNYQCRLRKYGYLNSVTARDSAHANYYRGRGYICVRGVYRCRKVCRKICIGR